MKFLRPLMLVSMLLFVRCEDNDISVYQYDIPQITSDGWTTSSLSEVGLRRSNMEKLINLLASRDDHYVHGIAIARKGKLVLEYYLPLYDSEGNNKGYDGEDLHFQASVSKSFTSALCGIAIDQGLLPDIETEISDLYPEYTDIIQGEKESITLHHVLSMTSGLDWADDVPYNTPDKDGYHLIHDDDPIHYVLSKEMVFTPGSQFLYNSGNTVILGDLIEKASGMGLETFAEEYLFGPLGIEDHYWEVFSSGIAFSSGGLYLNMRDMLKLGQLYIDDGVWNGKQVVPAAWIRQSLSEHIPLPLRYLGDVGTGYGYQWWLGEYGHDNMEAFIAAGWGGQFVIGIPEMELVVAVTGGEYLRSNPFAVYEMIIEDYILRGIDG